MKILFLSTANSIHTVRWVNALAERGHRVFLIFNKDHGAGENPIDARVTLVPLKFGGTIGYFLNVFQLHSIFQKIKPDIVNAHYASGYGTLARLAKVKPYLLSVWGSDVYEFPYKNSFNHWLIKKNLNYADQIASTSKCMAKQVYRILNKKIPIVITPFGVNIHKFKVKERTNNTKNEIIIGCVKTLEKKYGITYLIYAIDLLIRNLTKNGNAALAKKIRCHIYGEGSQRKELEQLIQRLDRKKSIQLFGKIPNHKVPEILQTMDIFCAASIHNSESFGVAVVEAQATGLAVVVSDVDGFQEVVETGITGIVVERKNVAKIAEALETLVMNEELRITLGTHARKKVEQSFNWEKNVTTMEKCYRQVAEEKRG